MAFTGTILKPSPSTQPQGCASRGPSSSHGIFRNGLLSLSGCVSVACIQLYSWFFVGFEAPIVKNAAALAAQRPKAKAQPAQPKAQRPKVKPKVEPASKRRRVA